MIQINFLKDPTIISTEFVVAIEGGKFRPCLVNFVIGNVTS